MSAIFLETSEYHEYYKTYIEKAAQENIADGLRENLEKIVLFYSSIPESKHNFAYEDGKWTIKQILLHITDTERIFAYRALRIARRDKTPLVGYEQDDYIKYTNTDKRSLESIISEYTSVRKASISLFESFNKEDLLQIGQASGASISVRAIGYILTGHENHHSVIIKERYLSE